MKQHRHTVMIFILILSLAGCTLPGTSSPEHSESEGQSPIQAAPAALSDEDSDEDWEEATSTILQLNGSSIAVEGDGAAADGSAVTITSAGTYVLRGTLDDGQIVIQAPDTATVRLVLDGAELASSTTSPIHCSSADKLIITVAAGSANTVTDAEEYQFPDAGTDEPNAAIFSKVDLTLNGSGSLEVSGRYYNGIGTKDNLVITNGQLTVTAVNDALRGRDSVTITGGSFTLAAGSDGIKSNHDTNENRGWVNISGGDFFINAQGDGIQAETVLTIAGGAFDITTGGGSEARLESSDDTSRKGLKGGTSVTLSGGSFVIDSLDDAIHSNGDITVAGGNFIITTGDDGMHADENLAISGGDIDIQRSYEGIEGATITISGGNISVVSSDDGINVAGGNDTNGPGGRGGWDSFATSGDYWLLIEGGTIHVNASGDGIDVNGNATMTGGTVFVNGPTANMDGALDYDGTFEISGGILIAAGSSGMAEAPSSGSTQLSVMFYYSSDQAADTLASLLDADGNAIVSFAPTKQYRSLVISTPDLAEGATYTLYTGGSHSGSYNNGYYSGGNYVPGDKLTDVTLSGSLTRVSDTGEAVSGGFGMGMGGGRGGGGMGGPGGGRPGEGEDMGAPPDLGEMPTGDPPAGGPGGGGPGGGPGGGRGGVFEGGTPPEPPQGTET